VKLTQGDDVSKKTCNWLELPPDWAMKSHGHVAKRPDGVRARCGGPSLCETCQLELFYFKLIENHRKELNKLEKETRSGRASSRPVEQVQETRIDY
jgi:hypothetical protein